MKAYLPNSAFLHNIESFIKPLDSQDQRFLEITAHNKWITVHPVVIAMIASMSEQTRQKNVLCQRIEARSAHYFERIGLFEYLGIDTEKNVTEHEPTGRFIPLTKISNAEEMTNFVADIIPLLHPPPEKAQPIRYVFSELIRNVIEHAHTDHAIVCAQYHKDINTIRVGVVDSGIGLKASLEKTYIVKNDEEAIRLALMPGITGTTTRIGGTEQNAGAGLFFTKSLAKMSRSYFVIYSGNTLYKLLKTPKKSQVRLYPDPFTDKHTLLKSITPWKGTAIGIDINLDTEKPFSEFLSILNNTLKKTVQERKQQLRKKARFT